MFPIETKAMVQAFSKNKRHKSINPRSTNSMVKFEKRGWNFIKKMNKQLNKMDEE